MKKIVLMMAAALTFTVASAQECKKDEECCKKDSTETCCKECKKDEECCKKDCTETCCKECKKDEECCKKDCTETCCKENKEEVKNERPHMVDMMAKKLELSDEQKAKVEELNKKYGIDEQRMTRMHGGPQGMHKGNRPQGIKGERQQGNKDVRIENMKKYNDELKTILTPEQLEKYDNMRKARMQGPRSPRK